MLGKHSAPELEYTNIQRGFLPGRFPLSLVETLSGVPGGQAWAAQGPLEGRGLCC